MTFGMASDGTTLIPRFIKIGHVFKGLNEDLVSVLYFLKKRETGSKKLRKKNVGGKERKNKKHGMLQLREIMTYKMIDFGRFLLTMVFP
jgi:hypothetical protein